MPRYIRYFQKYLIQKYLIQKILSEFLVHTTIKSKPTKNSGFPCSSAGKESACNAGDLGLIPGLGRSPGERKGYPFQYSGLENPMDSIVYGGRKESDTTK